MTDTAELRKRVEELEAEIARLEADEKRHQEFYEQILQSALNGYGAIRQVKPPTGATP